MVGLPDDLPAYRPRAPDLMAAARRLIPRRRSPPAPPEAPGAAAGQPAVEPGAIARGVDWASRWLQLPDLAVGWLPWAVSEACRAARRHGCRVIYSSAPPWTAHLVALLTKRLTGLPWVADFRDPWRANPFRAIPFPSIDRADAWLERRVVLGADRVICNSEAVRDDFRGRFPVRDDRLDRFATIPNGFDPEDFADLVPRRSAGPDRLVLTHAGVFYGRRSPEPIFRALRLLRDRGAGGRELLLQLVGPPEFEGRCLREIADSHGVGDLVELTGRVDHRPALELMKGSDIQVLVGFNGPGSELQVPAKLFEYMGVGRSVLALAPGRGAMREILAQSRIDSEVCDPDDPEAIAGAIARLAERPGGGRSEPAENPSLAQFHRRDQVRRIADLLDASDRGHA